MLKLLINGVDTTKHLQLAEFNCTSKANNSDTLTFRLKNPSMPILPGYEVQLYFGENLLYGGLLQSTTPSDMGTYTSVLCYCVGYKIRCSHRTCSVWYSPVTETTTTDADGKKVTTYTGTWTKEIVESIYKSALQDEGFILGVIDKGAEIKEWKKSALSVQDAFDNMANIAGLTWSIDKHKVLNFSKEWTMKEAPKMIDTTQKAANVYTGIVGLTVTQTLENYRNRQHIVGVHAWDQEDVCLGMDTNTQEVSIMQQRFGTGIYGNVFEDSKVIRPQDAKALAEHYLKAYGGLPTTVAFRKYIQTPEDGLIEPNTLLYVKAPKLGLSTHTLFYIHTVAYTLEGATLCQQVQGSAITPDKAIPLPNGISTMAEVQIVPIQATQWVDDMAKLKGTPQQVEPTPKTKISNLIGATITDDGFSAQFTDGDISATYELDGSGNIKTIKIKDGQTITIR